MADSPSQLSKVTYPPVTLILDFWPSELWDNKFPLYKTPSLWHFAKAAPEKQYTPLLLRWSLHSPVIWGGSCLYREWIWGREPAEDPLRACGNPAEWRGLRMPCSADACEPMRGFSHEPLKVRKPTLSSSDASAFLPRLYLLLHRQHPTLLYLTPQPPTRSRLDFYSVLAFTHLPVGVISAALVSTSCDSCNLCSHWIAKIADKCQVLESFISNWGCVPVPNRLWNSPET